MKKHIALLGVYGWHGQKRSVAMRFYASLLYSLVILLAIPTPTAAADNTVKLVKAIKPCGTAVLGCDSKCRGKPMCSPSYDANIPFLKLSAQIPSEGEDIVVVGNPLGLESSVSTGIVSAVRDIPALGNIIQITSSLYIFPH